MGIFDDAIRQHLDLKRRQGADESELKQLEDEAFGLPARPGDPDFPETGEQPDTTGETGGDGAATTPTPLEGEAAAAAPAGKPDPPTEGGSLEALVEEEDAEPALADDSPPHGDPLLDEPEAKPEPPAADEGPVEDEGAASFSTAEREAIAGQPTEFFDQPPAEMELGELDLDLSEEIDEVGALEEEPLTGEELVEETAPASEEQPGEDQPIAEPEPEEQPAEEAEAAPEPAEASADEAPSGDQPAEDAEDVLEETPEFLRDNPDDDELWFEQGKPKDFDF